MIKMSASGVLLDDATIHHGWTYCDMLGMLDCVGNVLDYIRWVCRRHWFFLLDAESIGLAKAIGDGPCCF